MAESQTGGSNKKDLSMETRLLLVFLLMGAIMFLTPYFFPSATTPAKKGTAKQTAQTAQPAQTGQPVATPEPEPPAPEPPETQGTAPTSPATKAKPEPAFTIDTDVFHIVFGNQGATVRSWLLKKHKAGGKALELVNAAPAIEDPYPFSLYMPDRKNLAKKLDWAYYAQTPEPDGLGVSFEFSDGHTVARKTFRFEKTSYLAHVTSEVATDGKPVPHMIEWRGGFGDLTVANPSATEKTLYFDLTNNKLQEQTAKGGDPITNSGNFSFAGIEDTYFTALFLPEGNASMQLTTLADYIVKTPGEKPQPYTGVAVSSGAANRFELFVGPKDLDLLKRVNPKLEQVVNFGWLSILAKPLFLIVNWINDNIVRNFGWAIVLVTTVINFILFPLKLANMKSMRKMQALKPQIDVINAKYKNIKMTDQIGRASC